MSLLDQPTDTVTVVPQMVANDAYGTPVAGTPAAAVKVRCRVQPLVTLDQTGQATYAQYRIVARSFPRGPFSKVTWNGRDWEIVGEPQRHNGSPRTAHVSVDIKALSPEV